MGSIRLVTQFLDRLEVESAQHVGGQIESAQLKIGGHKLWHRKERRAAWVLRREERTQRTSRKRQKNVRLQVWKTGTA